MTKSVGIKGIPATLTTVIRLYNYLCAPNKCPNNTIAPSSINVMLTKPSGVYTHSANRANMNTPMNPLPSKNFSKPPTCVMANHKHTVPRVNVISVNIYALPLLFNMYILYRILWQMSTFFASILGTVSGYAPVFVAHCGRHAGITECIL